MHQPARAYLATLNFEATSVDFEQTLEATEGGAEAGAGVTIAVIEGVTWTENTEIGEMKGYHHFGKNGVVENGRGRSPNYGSRETRDGLPNIEIDRARVGSRDGPLSGGSPASDSVAPFARGYGRAPRGGRGRGRGIYYEEGFHRPPGRSRSPEPAYRRTQPSATPPPQVPAFGSSTSLQTSTITPLVPNPNSTPAAAAGPLPGVAVPTAPRSERQIGPKRSFMPSIQYRPTSAPKKDSTNSETFHDLTFKSASSNPLEIKKSITPQGAEASAVHQSPDASAERIRKSPREAQHSLHPRASEGQVSREKQQVRHSSRRHTVFHTIGKRNVKLPASTSPKVTQEVSDSESEDELTDGYFEEEITKIDTQVIQVNVENPLNPQPEPPAVFLKPFVESTIDSLVEVRRAAPADACIPPGVKVEEALPAPSMPVLTTKQGIQVRSSSHTPATVPKPLPTGKSRPATPVAESKYFEEAKLIPNGVSAPAPGNALSTKTPLPSAEPLETPVPGPAGPIRSIEQVADTVAARTEPNIEPKPDTNGTARKSIRMDVFEESEGDVSEAENAEILEAVRESVRPRMKTPPVSSLPNFGSKKWYEDEQFLNTLKPNPAVNARIRQNLKEKVDRKLAEQEEARKIWGEKYYTYRRFTDFSNDPVAVRSREKFSKATAKAAAQAAAKLSALELSAGAKTEGSRRGRFATDADLERVLIESALEAKESKEQEDRAARAKTASAKEATIPDAAWDQEEWESNQFIDRSHLVPFDRSFAVLEFGEPIDNFTQEESEIFEKVYLEFPKQWSKIAAALPRRDYKACIQHYYLVKHSSNIKEKLKKQPKKRKSRQTKAKNPKTNILIVDSAPNREETEDGQDGENSERRGRPRRAAAPTFHTETMANEGELASPVPTPGRKSAAAPKGDTGNDIPPTKKKPRVAREKGTKQAKNGPLLAAAPPNTAATGSVDSPAPPMIPADWKTHCEPGVQNRFSFSQYDAAGQSQPASTFTPPFPHAAPDRPNTSTGTVFESMPHNRVSQPPMSQPPISQPPMSQPPISQPPMSQAPMSQPPISQPPISQPPMSQPSTSYPPNSQPPMPQHFPGVPERAEPAAPVTFDAQQDRRTTQQTSSYWSVPEQTDFPALLKHFGTDWHGIAKWMTSKTNIMVYTNIFQRWLTVPSDSNKSRRVANILTQVKNYYQRQVDSGKKEWEAIAKEADEKRDRDEPTAPLPTPSVIPKRRYDITPGAHPRSASAMDQVADVVPSGQSALMSQTSPPQTSMGSRFPVLAQAGPVAQTQPNSATSNVLNKHLPPQPIQQAPPPIQQQPRPLRGPAVGYFSSESPRPTVQADAAVSQRSMMVAQEAQIERQSALRLERESALRLEREQREQQQLREQQQQQQQQQQRDAQREQQAIHQREQQLLQREQHAMQQRDPPIMHRDRNFHLKQENETPNPHQYEPFSTPSMHGGMPPQPRPEPPKPISAPQSEVRRSVPTPHLPHTPQHAPQQYQPRSNQIVRPYPGDGFGGGREIKSTASPASLRTTMSAPPANQEMYSAPPPLPPQQIVQPPPQQAPTAVVRQPEPARKSNIMSLLNDEPSDPRPAPAKRVSDMSTPSVQPTRTPPPQHPQHTSRQPIQSLQNTSQPHPYISHQMTSQPTPQQQVHTSPHPYTQPPQHPLHQHSSSIGHPRSYTPNSYDGRPAYSQPLVQQQQQQPYSQPAARQSMTSQPTQVRREPPHGEMHGMSGAGGYSRSPAQSQPSMRLKESPYSATPPPQPPQAIRQPAGSPLDSPVDQRDYYSRQPQQGYFAQQQLQQQHAAASPQHGPSYQSQTQQSQAPSHRQLAFGPNSPHVPSPPTQYASHHVHQSRHSSFDSRYGVGTSGPGPSSGPTFAHQGYSPHHTPGNRLSGPVGAPRIITDHERILGLEMGRRRDVEEARRAEDIRRIDLERPRERGTLSYPSAEQARVLETDAEFRRSMEELHRPSR
ncbi:myb-like DNA-binding domain-containing protein [Diplocarpon rosae]|nr:myb-like DNA-binding domain-containing protein [Diplocarpon rosae]